MSDSANSASANFSVIDLDLDQPDQPDISPALQSEPSASIHSGRHPIAIPTPTRYTATPPSGPGSLVDRSRITVALDTEILMAAEDQAEACGQTLAEWCQVNVNDALRGYLGA